MLTSDGWLPFKKKHFGHDQALFDEAGYLNHQAGKGLIGQSEFIREIAKKAEVSPQVAAAEINRSAPNDELLTYIATELKPHYRTAILSNAGGNYLSELFSPEQLDLFDEVALSFEMGVVKPDERAYIAVLDKLGVQANEAVFVDDQERHCAGAREAGLQAILYADFDQFKGELEALLAEPQDSPQPPKTT